LFVIQIHKIIIFHIIYMKFKKIVLRKTSDQPAEVMYEDHRGKQYKELTNDDFNHLLEKTKLQ